MAKKHYDIERHGQADFFDNFHIDYLHDNSILIDNTDGVYHGNILEFKLNISNTGKVLLQAIKYLSRMRIKGESVPARIMLIDLNDTKVYVYHSADYIDDIQKVYVGASSVGNDAFNRNVTPAAIYDYTELVDAAEVQKLLINRAPANWYIPIDLDESCIVGWAERYYREIPNATKGDFLGDGTGKINLNGEIRDPKHFAGLINPYTEPTNEKFKYLGFKSLLRHFDAEEPAVPESTELRIIRTRKEAEEACAAFAEKERIGISLCEMEGKHVLGLSDGEEKTAILSGAMLSGADLTAAAEQLAAKVPCLSACGIKQLRKRCAFDFGPQFFDCRIAGYLLNPLKSEWSYDVISADYLGRTVPSRTELLGKKGLSALGAQAEEKMAECAAYEAEVSFLTQPVLLQKLQETGMEGLFREIEMPLAFVLAEMELAGILCSESELAAYGSRLEKRINELTAAIYEEAGEVFNLNSPKQLGQILFEKLQLPGGKKTKTGYSTAADVLEKLAAHEPIAANILEYRTYSKLKSTYADGLAAYIGEDGRIRTTFHQTVTATGRLSSADPNLQNIPMREELGRLIRKCFYPSEGCVFVDADYSQIELRILAHMSGDEKLIEAYREAKDIHRITASQVFHVPFEEVTDEMRRNAKAVNFGIVYGISSFGLSQGLSISRQEAADYIELYFAAYPGIKSFLDGLVASAKETGYAVSLFGRRRPIPELRAANFMQRSFGERAAMNSPIQGTAADIMKIAMLRVSRRLKEEQKKARIILQIHDELLVEGHIGRDWYEAK